MRLLVLSTLLLVSPVAPGEGGLPLVEHGKFPNRVHVIEDFETEIERRWWHRGVEETKDLHPSSPSFPNKRAWCSGASGDFDDKQGDCRKPRVVLSFRKSPHPDPSRRAGIPGEGEREGAAFGAMPPFTRRRLHFRMFTCESPRCCSPC